MAIFDRSTYEIQVLMDDHWIFNASLGNEAAALAKAKELIESRTYDGAKVVRLWQRSDGDETEKVIWSKTTERAQAPVRIVPIQDAPPCKDVEDFYGFQSRLTIGRLLRKYLDESGLIQSEMLHVHSAFKRYLDSELYPSSVDRVATVQCEGTDKDVRTRRDEIYAIIDKITSRAMRAEGRQSIRRCNSTKIKDMIAAAEDAVETSDERDFLVTFILCRETTQTRNLVGKLEWLLSSLPGDLAPRDMVIVDNLLADLVAAPTVVQELLGNQKNLCTAICSLLDLIEGKECPHSPNVAETMGHLRTLFQNKRLPITTDAVLDFILRQIKGKGPLARNDASQENDAFLTIMSRTFIGDRIIGGPEMADSLLVRHSRRMEQGGATGIKQALDVIMSMIPEAAFRLRFLMALCRGGPHMAIAAARMTTEAKRLTSINALCPPRSTAAQKLRTVRAFQDAVETTHMIDDDKKAFLNAMDRLATDCLNQEKVIESLDDKKDSLRVRAERLVKFCGSGILREDGRALTLARSQVLNYLRQPNFIQEFTAGISDPKQAEAHIKAFYILLSQSGFKT